jgi:hypothetical protein
LRELDAMDEGDPVREQLSTFREQRPALAALFDAAGPADDGTLDGAIVQGRMPPAASPAEATQELAAALHEYASYALFLARPHLRRRDEGIASQERKARLSTRVTAMLDPIAPVAKRTRSPRQ